MTSRSVTRGRLPDEVLILLNHIESVIDKHPELDGLIDDKLWNDVTALANQKPFNVSVQTMVESHQTTHVLTLERYDRPADATVFDSDGRITPYRTLSRENAESEAVEWDAFLNGSDMSKFERLTARFDGKLNWTNPDA